MGDEHLTGVNRLAHLVEEVLFTEESLVIVDRHQMEVLKQKALQNRRSRIRLCAHMDTANPLHEMLIIHARGNYIPPHKHLNKSESFHVIEGATTIIIFDEEGQITNVIPMGDYSSGEVFFYRIPAGCYHCHIVTSDVFVYHETTNGPFKRSDTILAPWAPDESDDEAAKIYMDKLCRYTK